MTMLVVTFCSFLGEYKNFGYRKCLFLFVTTEKIETIVNALILQLLQRNVVR